VEYRQASLGDLDAIANLHAKSWQETYIGILSDEYLEGNVLQDRLEVWRKRLTNKNKNQTVLLAEEANNLLGFICLVKESGEETILLDNLHIDSSHKGKGLGRQLIDRALSSLGDLKGLSLYLEVLAKNEDAIRFYERLEGKRTETNVWNSPCGSKVEEFVYVWPSADEFLELLKRKVEVKQK
jgi:ribosomal protein S18 acetylase RimI-like enzyme